MNRFCETLTVFSLRFTSHSSTITFPLSHFSCHLLLFSCHLSPFSCYISLFAPSSISQFPLSLLTREFPTLTHHRPFIIHCSNHQIIFIYQLTTHQSLPFTLLSSPGINHMNIQVKLRENWIQSFAVPTVSCENMQFCSRGLQCIKFPLMRSNLRFVLVGSDQWVYHLK